MAQRSDTGFTIGVVVVALLAAGFGVYVLGRRGADSAVAGTAATNHAIPHQTQATPRHAQATPHQAGPPASRRTRAAAVTVVRQNAALTLRGRYDASCALESPAYQRFDALHYAQGSCAAAEEAAMAAVAARGITPRLEGTRIVSFGHGRATVLVTTIVGSRVSTHVFLQYHHGRWWITGGDDSGDLGY